MSTVTIERPVAGEPIDQPVADFAAGARDEHRGSAHQAILTVSPAKPDPATSSVSSACTVGRERRATICLVEAVLLTYESPSSEIADAAENGPSSRRLPPMPGIAL